MQCLNQWKHRYPELFKSLKLGKAEANARTEKSLYMRANGFHYDAVKIFCWKDGKVTKVPYRKYVIPDVTAGIFWLKNRDPANWRDVQNINADVGHYIISDRPMTEEQWIAERTKVIESKRVDSTVLAADAGDKAKPLE